jgi:hypothetical protein
VRDSAGRNENGNGAFTLLGEGEGGRMMIDTRHKERFRQECEAVKRLGDQIGYGNMMTIASALWAKDLIDNELPDEDAFYPTILSNMKPGDLTVSAMSARALYLRLLKEWEDES